VNATTSRRHSASLTGTAGAPVRLLSALERMQLPVSLNAETPDNPPRADAIMPLPRVGELARRFEDQTRSCIDPPLPRLQIRAIETDGQGGGVIVFRTSASRAAPHRLNTTREAYVRRGASTGAAERASDCALIQASTSVALYWGTSVNPVAAENRPYPYT